MSSVITRRSLLASAPLLAGAAVINPLWPQEKPQYYNGPPELALNIVSGTQSQFNVVGAKSSLYTLVPSDINNAVGWLGQLISNFNSVNFDYYAAQAMKTISPNTAVSVAGTPLFNSLYSGLTGAGARMSQGQLAYAFGQNMPTSQTSSMVTYVQNNGLTSALGNAKSHLSARAQQIDFCAGFNFWAGAIGTAAFSLSWGCATPFFEVICPAIGVLGIIAGIIGILDFLFC